MNFDAVIFDCDGVLVDSEVLSVRGERTVLAEMGLDYGEAEFVRRFVGLHDVQFLGLLRADYEAKFSKPAPKDFDHRVIEGRAREMADLTAIEGAQDALRAARQSAGRIGVASSSRAHFLDSKLKRTGLFDLCTPHIYSADLVANGKPAPDIFLLAAQKLGVRPGGCLVIEDSENGVRAGLAAGMSVWGFTAGGHCFDGYGEQLMAAGAGWVAPDFAALIARLPAYRLSAP